MIPPPSTCEGGDGLPMSTPASTLSEFRSPAWTIINRRVHLAAPGVPQPTNFPAGRGSDRRNEWHHGDHLHPECALSLLAIRGKCQCIKMVETGTAVCSCFLLTTTSRSDPPAFSERNISLEKPYHRSTGRVGTRITIPTPRCARTLCLVECEMSESF